MHPGTACNTCASLIFLPKYSLISVENCIREMMSLTPLPQKVYKPHFEGGGADICT